MFIFRKDSFYISITTKEIEIENDLKIIEFICDFVLQNLLS